jgi:hypothetical protein
MSPRIARRQVLRVARFNAVDATGLGVTLAD